MENAAMSIDVDIWTAYCQIDFEGCRKRSPFFSVTNFSSCKRNGMTGATSPYVTPSVRHAVQTVNRMKAFELLKVETRDRKVISAA